MIIIFGASGLSYITNVRVFIWIVISPIEYFIIIYAIRIIGVIGDTDDDPIQINRTTVVEFIKDEIVIAIRHR